jgi:hypothetical protein
MADLHALVADVTSYARHPAKASSYTRNPWERAARRGELEQAALKLRGWVADQGGYVDPPGATHQLG